MSDQISIREVFSSIQGEGLLAGLRQIFIRLAECNLDCRYCDTAHGRDDQCNIETYPGSGVFASQPQPPTLHKLIEIVTGWKDQVPQGHHSISITGGEPLLHAEALVEWLPGLRSLLPIHLETNGTMHLALQRVIAHLDGVSMDMKLPSTSGCTEHLWGLHREFLQVAVACSVSVKVVVGAETPDDEIRQVCSIVGAVGQHVPLFLQPLTLPGGKLGITARRLLQLQAVAASLAPDVRVMPQMHLMLGAL